MGTDKGRDTQGCAWQSKLALRFQIPSQASLARDYEIYRSFCSANGPALPKNLSENTGLRLVSKRGDVVKKHLQARLRVSFPQQIQHSHSESTPCFLAFPSVYILVIRG
jgi:hypothetical protein